MIILLFFFFPFRGFDERLKMIFLGFNSRRFLVCELDAAPPPSKQLLCQQDPLIISNQDIRAGFHIY